MATNNWVHLDDVTVLEVRDKSVKVRYDGQELFLPLSQIDPDIVASLAAGDVRTLTITEWIANERGLDGD